MGKTYKEEEEEEQQQQQQQQQKREFAKLSTLLSWLTTK